MSKLTDKLGTLGIHNDHNLLAKGHPMIHYDRQHNSRSPIPDTIMLTLEGMSFKDAAWYFLGDTKEAFQKALDWVEKRFPGMKMVKSPFGNSPFSVIPEVDLQAAIAKLPEEKKELDVYHGDLMLNGKQVRILLAAKTRAEAARITGEGKNHIKNYWTITKNANDIKLARSKPGIIFYTGMSYGNEEWKEWPKHD